MSQRRTTFRTPVNSRGFTLVELMVTVSVLVILAAIALPSMTTMVNNGRVAGQTEELVSALQLARAEAIRRNARVTVCAGTGIVCSGSTTWGNWTIFGRDKTSATPNTNENIRDTAPAGPVVVTGPAAGIVFKPSGLIDTQQTLEVAHAGNKRCIRVLISGVVSTSKGGCP